MSHLHIPDGVLLAWLRLMGLGLMVLLLAVALKAARKGDLRRYLPLLGFTSAVMLVGMTLEIVPIAYHLNLSVMTGILPGPAMAFLASFLVNLMLALAGHGGVTVVGLNTLILGLETFSGYWLFRLLQRITKPALAAGCSVVLTLFLSKSLVIGLATLSRFDPLQREESPGVGHREEQGLLALPGAGPTMKMLMKARRGRPVGRRSVPPQKWELSPRGFSSWAPWDGSWRPWW